MPEVHLRGPENKEAGRDGVGELALQVAQREGAVFPVGVAHHNDEPDVASVLLRQKQILRQRRPQLPPPTEGG